MKVEKGKKVTMEYTITTDKGELIESSLGRGMPLSFVVGDGRMLACLSEQEADVGDGCKKAVADTVGD